MGPLSQACKACYDARGLKTLRHARRLPNADRNEVFTSTPNRTIRTHLSPLARPADSSVRPAADLDEPPTSPAGTILLVDDDPDIRSLIRTFLEHTGFRVFTSADAHRALCLFHTSEQRSAQHTAQRSAQHSSQNQGRDLRSADRSLPVRPSETGAAATRFVSTRPAQQIDLLIADQYMPHGSGMELALELKQHRPGLPVLLISGGILETAHLSQLAQPGWNFLPKPFSLPELLSTVHRILTPAAIPVETKIDRRIQLGVGESNTIS